MYAMIVGRGMFVDLRCLGVENLCDGKVKCEVRM
jgi:hypothetical protein